MPRRALTVRALTRISALRWADYRLWAGLYRHWPGGDENRYRWIERLMPPVVTGAVVMAIG